MDVSQDDLWYGAYKPMTYTKHRGWRSRRKRKSQQT
jgi:hypothetical protein